MADPRIMPAEPTTELSGRTGRRSLAASIAAIGVAFLASLCCIGPVLFVILGVGGAGLASRFEPFRPVLTVLTVGLLALGFYSVYARRPPQASAASCEVDGTCVVPRSRTRDRILIWIAALFALIILTFPQWSAVLL